jgi:polyhydroxybutyrate depolymerase
MGQPKEFYMDEHVSRAVIHGLRQRGADVLTLHPTDQQREGVGMTSTGSIVFAIVCTLLAGTTAAAEPTHGNFASNMVKIGDVQREYRLVVPKTVDLAKPAPLVIAFHGMLIDSKDLMPFYTRLNQTAEKHKFILAYPNAIDKSWGLAPDKVISDLAFFDALLAKLTADYKIDAERVYVLGMSNGGYFAHLVGKERSKTVAAVASHSGPFGLQTLFGVNADRKFPVLIIHGDQDKLLPVDWARENRDKYKREGHEVKYVELAGYGHVWGTKADVNETIWKFFADHPLEK